MRPVGSKGNEIDSRGGDKSHCKRACKKGGIVAAIFEMGSTTACLPATKVHIPPTCKKTTHFLPRTSSPVTASDSGLGTRTSSLKSAPGCGSSSAETCELKDTRPPCHRKTKRGWMTDSPAHRGGGRPPSHGQEGSSLGHGHRAGRFICANMN